MPMKILVAEDDLTTRSVLKAVLMKWGYEVETLDDGTAAWERLRQPDAPKLALLDWMMPGLDGPEICRRLRVEENPLPPYLILLTARSRKEDIVQGLHSGANDYILKPFDNDELRARLAVGERMLELQEKLFQAIEHQKTLAMTDALTGILNRRAILRHLEMEIARGFRSDSSLWVAVLDLDHFKKVNDTYGHLAGDVVLKESAARISELIRKYDSFGRYGGEEFLLVLPIAVEGRETKVLDRIRKTISGEGFAAEGRHIRVTASLGAVKWNGRDTIDEIIRKADDALYLAKKKGRDRVEFAS